MDQHVSLMRRAIALGRQSLPFCGVNPAVGAVLARGPTILGEGWHRGPGSPHAEAAALAAAIATRGDPQVTRGASLYCTLEPCCHQGGGKRTPPCAQAIIQAGISHVLVACQDPNPLVAGRGIAMLRAAGIEVTESLCADQAEMLIEHFRVSIQHRRPFITLKWAQSLDGRLACGNGQSQWITPLAAREEAHALRASHDAVLVGAGTLQFDDPALTVRLAPGNNPRRLVLAGQGLLATGRQLFAAPLREGSLALVIADSAAHNQCREQGWPFQLVEVDPLTGLPEIGALVGTLYTLGIGALLVEGGPGLLGAFWKAGLWDRATIFQAPIVLGGGPSIGSTLSMSRRRLDVDDSAGHFDSPALAPRQLLVNVGAGDGYIRMDLRPGQQSPCLIDGGRLCSAD